MDDWFDSGRGAALDVAALMDSEAGAAVWRAVGCGALISLGLTSDGGALGITVTVDGRWRREYFRDADDLAGWLGDGLAAISDAVQLARATRGANGRQKAVRRL